MPSWLEQEAINETVFREMNEWAEEANDERLGVDRPTSDAYLCECSDRRCTQPITMSRLEYESVRSEATRFALALNHENPLLDLVLFENLRFATIEKVGGEASKIARASDPRR